MSDETKQLVPHTAGEVAPQDMKNAAIEYLRSTGLSLPAKYEAQFLNACVLYGLNPYKREIYAVGYGDKWNVIVGYEVYLKRAERTGKLDGWSCDVSGTGGDMKATLTVWRKDWSHPFVHEAWFAEMQQQSPIWRKMPRLMLKKTAIAQGFRQCFPDEMGGLPYTADELPVINVTPKESPSPTPQAEEQSIPESVELAEPVNAAAGAGLMAEEILQHFLTKYKDQLSHIAGKIEEYKANGMSADELLAKVKSYLVKKGVEL